MNKRTTAEVAALFLTNVMHARTEARSEALEEAARLCEGAYPTGSTASTLKALAKAIRDLKDK